MKPILILFLSCFFTVAVWGQNQLPNTNIDEITDIGKALYRSEMTSWLGTDAFMANFKSLRAKTGGYFSYEKDSMLHCIFYSKDSISKVLCVISFDRNFSSNVSQLDQIERPFTTEEQDYYELRKAAQKALLTDTIFKFYENTNPNIVPLIRNGVKSVYVLTGPKSDNVVIIGNDYLLSFNQHNELQGIKKLHKNIIPISYTNSDSASVTMHSHLPETGDYITPTDICTLMLYEKAAKWEQHIVMSKNHVTIWDCKNNRAAALTREAWEKIQKNY